MSIPGGRAKPRGKDRRRVLKAGVIASNGRHVTMPCGVRDLSEVGARLVYEGSVEPPDTFELLIELDGIAVGCEVAWRRGKELGVKFTEAPRTGERRRQQVVSQWAMTTAKPSLRRQTKTSR